MCYLGKYKKSEIENFALEVLKKCYDKSYSIPIDIELVAERSGYIEMIKPMKGIKSKFNVAAALCPTKNKKLIVVIDEEELDNNSVLARFSVAHELGHAILDSDICESVKQFTPKEALKISRENQGTYHVREAAADYFAGAVLMPRRNFADFVRDTYEEIAGKCDFDDKKIINRIGVKVSKKFFVSNFIADQRLVDTDFKKQIRFAAENRHVHLL